MKTFLFGRLFPDATLFNRAVLVNVWDLTSSTIMAIWYFVSHPSLWIIIVLILVSAVISTHMQLSVEEEDDNT